MNERNHLRDVDLTSLIDGELTLADEHAAQSHIRNCAVCRERLLELKTLSVVLARRLETPRIPVAHGARELLLTSLPGRQPSHVYQRGALYARWALAAAALVAVALLLGRRSLDRHSPVPAGYHTPVEPAQLSAVPTPAPPPQRASLSPAPAARRHKRQVQNLRDAGFTGLPYSNPALPLDSADVVRVRVPLSALESAGILRMQPGAPDALVQADVLLGRDGQPRAIRLVSSEHRP